jgi:hypothetical protein
MIDDTTSMIRSEIIDHSEIPRRRPSAGLRDADAVARRTNSLMLDEIAGGEHDDALHPPDLGGDRAGRLRATA